jgi:HAD superfamily hydrolase (TIGR01509 family)
MVTVRAALWDNDGVLVDTEGLYFRATREVLATVDVDLTRDRFVQLSLREGRSVFDLAADRGVPPAEIEGLRNRRNERYAGMLREGAPLLGGVEEALQSLHGQVSMGIVTSSRRDHFDLIHRASGLLRYFDFFLTREDYERSKPDPDPYRTAMTLHRLRAEECVVVEDSERGLLSARRAGIRCIVVPHELTAGGRFEGAHAVVPEVRDAAREILRLAVPPCP